MTDLERLSDSEDFSENNAGKQAKRLMGSGEWQGKNPYHIELVDQDNLVAYGFDLRGGVDWITIQKQTSEAPGATACYLLELKAGEWKYNDPVLAKHGESSLPQLEEIFQLLKIANQAFESPY